MTKEDKKAMLDLAAEFAGLYKDLRRENLWWETYNAALTGASSRKFATVDDSCGYARDCADAAHGPLDPVKS